MINVFFIDSNRIAVYLQNHNNSICNKYIKIFEYNVFVHKQSLLYIQNTPSFSSPHCVLCVCVVATNLSDGLPHMCINKNRTSVKTRTYIRYSARAPMKIKPKTKTSCDVLWKNVCLEWENTPTPNHSFYHCIRPSARSNASSTLCRARLDVSSSRHYNIMMRLK